MDAPAPACNDNCITELTITILYDNNPCLADLEAQWGFSALINGPEETILFDTGGADLLMHNMQKLHIDPRTIDAVVLSHFHWDHTGGLDAFLSANPNVRVYAPASFPREIKDLVRSRRAVLHLVDRPAKICASVHSTGELAGPIPEQSLGIRSARGLIVLTGCAHPGIADIIEKAGSLWPDRILLAMGGFHLKADTETRIERVIAAFKEMNVRYVAATHCTGPTARQLFQNRYGPHWIPAGLGSRIRLSDLK